MKKDEAAAAQIERWKELLTEAADIMRKLHEKGFEVHLRKVFIGDVPQLRSKIVYRMPKAKGK
jgi:hypothetical protein